MPCLWHSVREGPTLGCARTLGRAAPDRAAARAVRACGRGPSPGRHSFPPDGKGIKGSPGEPSVYRAETSASARRGGATERLQAGTALTETAAAQPVRSATTRPLLPAKGETARRFPPLDPPSGDGRRKLLRSRCSSIPHCRKACIRNGNQAPSPRELRAAGTAIRLPP